MVVVCWSWANYARDASLDTKVITKPFLCCCFFRFFLLQLFFDKFCQGNFKTELQDQNTSNEQLTTHTFSGEGRGKIVKKDTLSLGSMYGLLGLKQKVHSDCGSKILLGLITFERQPGLSCAAGSMIGSVGINKSP
jgi:hypothetical protein